MLIKYELAEQVLISADKYTVSPAKSVRDFIFGKYLFKIIRIPGINNSKQAEAICIKIESIQIIDNIILRKSADMKVKIIIGIVVLRLLPQQYYEGEVVRSDSKGVIIKFIGGLLEGRVSLTHMHKDTIYNEEKNQWILTTGDENNQGYQWNNGASVRFRILYTIWDKPFTGAQSQSPAMFDLIQLKADQPGLGPIQWWL